MNDEPEQPAENTAKESLDGIVQATQKHADGVIESINGTLAPVQTRASEVIESINGTLTPVQTNMNEAIESISGTLPPVQEKVTEVILTLNNIAPNTQTHANGVIGNLDKIAPATQTHANGVIGTLDKIPPATQAHANGVIGTLDKIAPATQTHANGVIGNLDKIALATQTHANGVIGTLDKIPPTTQTHANEVIGTLNDIIPTTQAHASGVIGTLNDIIPATQEHADNLKKHIESYHNELLIDGKDDEGNPVNSIKTENENYIKDQKGNFNQLRKDLEKEIRSLLPEAGAAGLASAYFEAKTRYGAVPYKKLTDDKTADETTWYIPNALWQFIGTNIKGVVFYTLFILPLIVIIYLMVSNNIEGLNDLISEDGKLNSNALLRRFFISSPFAMLSWFGWGSIRLNRRLYEEYNHKQRVMQLYHSFKKEVEVEGTDKQKQELLTIMLNNVGDKPSIAVHSGKEQNEKISFFGGMMVITRPIKKISDTNTDTDENDSHADDSNNDTDDANSGTDEGNK